MHRLAQICLLARLSLVTVTLRRSHQIPVPVRMANVDLAEHWEAVVANSHCLTQSGSRKTSLTRVRTTLRRLWTCCFRRAPRTIGRCPWS